jgi:CTP synthase (UTP-ammonia lyase)
VLGIADAEHEESSPRSSTLVISRLTCSLVGKTQKIAITPDSIAHRAYRGKEVMEQFFCNYGLNPAFRDQIRKSKLNITGVDPEGEVRIVELSDHPFYVATLFLPQVASSPGTPHPLIATYLEAAIAFQSRRKNRREKRSKALSNTSTFH